MNKAELIDAIAAKAGMKKTEADKFYAAFVETIADAMVKGDKVALAGFGSFEVKERAAKEGINPLTKEKIHIEACKVPALKFGKAFKDMLNQ